MASFNLPPLLPQFLHYEESGSHSENTHRSKPPTTNLFQVACRHFDPPNELYMMPSESVLNDKWNDRRKQGTKRLGLIHMPKEIQLQIFISVNTPYCIKMLSQSCGALEDLYKEHEGYIYKNWLLRFLPRSYVKCSMMSYMAERYRPDRETEFQWYMQNFVLPKDINCGFFNYGVAAEMTTRGKLAEDILSIVSAPAAHGHADLHLHTVPEKRCAVEALLIIDAASKALYRNSNWSILLEPHNTEWHDLFWTAFSSQEMLRFTAVASYMSIVFNHIISRQGCPVWRNWTWRHVPKQVRRAEWLFSQLLSIGEMHALLNQRGVMEGPHPLCLAKLFHPKTDTATLPSLMCNAVKARMKALPRPERKRDRQQRQDRESRLGELMKDAPEELCWEQWAELLGIWDGSRVCETEDCCLANSVIFTPLWDERRAVRRAKKNVCPRSAEGRIVPEDYLFDINWDFWAES